MSTAQLIVGQIVWWWLIVGAVFMAVEWEYGHGNSFLDLVSSHAIGTYGFRVALVLNIGTVVGGLAVWPLVAFRRLPQRVRTAVSPSRLLRRPAASPAAEPGADRDGGDAGTETEASTEADSDAGAAGRTDTGTDAETAPAVGAATDGERV